MIDLGIELDLYGLVCACIYVKRDSECCKSDEVFIRYEDGWTLKFEDDRFQIKQNDLEYDSFPGLMSDLVFVYEKFKEARNTYKTQIAINQAELQKEMSSIGDYFSRESPNT